MVFGRTDLTGEEDAAGFLGAVVSGKGNIDADNQGGEATLGRRISRNAEQATPERWPCCNIYAMQTKPSHQ